MDQSGRNYECISFIIALGPKSVMDVCVLKLPPDMEVEQVLGPWYRPSRLIF